MASGLLIAVLGVILPPRTPFFTRAPHAQLSNFIFEFPSDLEDEEGTHIEEAGSQNSISGETVNLALEQTVEYRPLDGNYTVAQIKDMLKKYGQKTSGRKQDLLDRLEKVRRKEAAGIPVNDQEVHSDTELKWYMLQTANGFEGTVERMLRNAIDVQHLEDEIAEIYVPMAPSDTSVRDSSRMPSYLFIRMRMNQELHSFITGMTYVIQFVGADHGLRNRSGQMAGGRGFVWPRPISDEQFNAVKQLSLDPLPRDEPSFGDVFLVDDFVEVTKGPFRGLSGPVVAIGSTNRKEDDANVKVDLDVQDGDLITVELKVMGRVTPVTGSSRHCVEKSPEEAASTAPSSNTTYEIPSRDSRGEDAGEIDDNLMDEEVMAISYEQNLEPGKEDILAMGAKDFSGDTFDDAESDHDELNLELGDWLTDLEMDDLDIDQ